jgi:hypothetical protein
MTCAATGGKRFFLNTNYHEFTLNYFKGGLWQASIFSEGI